MTSLLTKEVAAQRDGVHYTVDNDSGEPASINGLGFDVEPGRSTKVHGTKPGVVEIACYPYSRHDDPEPPTQPLRVKDPDRFWIDPSLECAALVQGTVIHDFVDEGTREDPVLVVRDDVGGIRDDDVVERAGYPELTPPRVRIVREGQTVANVIFETTPSGGWHSGSVSSCSDANLGNI